MKILHIWNTAGVGSIIAKYMDKTFGTESWVIMRKRFDKFGFTTYGECWDCRGKIFTLKSLLKARKYDLIHVHAFDRIVPLLKLLYPKKPVVLHYHGTDIRGKAEERKRYYRKADFIIVSTPDLLETLPDATYIPNPVDTELFYPRNIYEPKTSFHISYRADELAKKYAKQYNLKLYIHDRETAPIPHIKFPDVLSKYEYYIDVKRFIDGKIATALSKTALEALACGLKVINWNGEIVHPPLPQQHLPEEVCSRVFKIYKGLVTTM